VPGTSSHRRPSADPASHVNTSLAQNVAQVRQRIADACQRAGRNPGDVTLIAVSKFVPVSVVSSALALGIRDFGESRPQELERKCATVPGERSGGRARWHMIGSIQRNKARTVVECADVIHSVDSVRLARALSDRVPTDEDRACLVQINISGEQSKSGFSISDAIEAVRTVSSQPGLRVCGLMGMAAYSDDPEEARSAFASLRSLAEQINSHDVQETRLSHLSMGMSNDYEVAIEEGATMVRVGTAIFGART